MLEIDIKDDVATLWLARPEARNALDEALIAELTRTFEAIGARSDIHVVVLGGRGSAFCAGADLHWMRRMAEASHEDNRSDALALASLFETVDRLPQPVIARVQGACFGGAIGLVCACDIVIAAEEARFAFSEVRLGLVPATIMPFVLRAIGHRAATPLMLTGEAFDARHAKAISLIHQHVPAEDLDATLTASVQALRQGGPRAQRETKTLLRYLHARTLDPSVKAHTAEVIAEARVSSEAQQRLKAFLE
jgi:methylglutaconyl-CoA hydratase